MSHKSGHIIINSMLVSDHNSGQPLACLSPQECAELAAIRSRDEYTIADRLKLAMIVASHADDPAE